MFSCRTHEAIELSNAMKKVLERATTDFEAKLKLLAEKSDTTANVRPVTVTHHAPLSSDGTDFTRELYIMRLRSIFRYKYSTDDR